MSEGDMNTIGDILRYKRKRMKLTQKQLAKKVGVSVTAYNYWERGIYFPNALNLCDLADLFGCTVDELVGRTKLNG